jgi:glycosyltransferase involved in cell wall biosynthesis
MLPYKSATQSGILGIAYGFERPVIVTNVGGLAESVEHGKTGLVVEPESPEALAEAVQQFYELRTNTDFSANVRAKATANSFANIYTVFEEICSR